MSDPSREVRTLRRALGHAATVKRIFVRSVMNFVIGDEWFFSIFKLKMGDSSKKR